MADGPKILVIDIETAPLESYTWGTFKQNVGLNQIKTDWTMLSVAAGWLHGAGVRKVEYRDNSEQEDVRDDRHLLQWVWALLDEADIVIGQNHKRFDLRKIRARLIVEGYAPFRPVKTVDTLEEARKLFAFTSHKLEWMSQILTDEPKDSHKDFPGFELWRECLAGNPKAWRSMRKYNPKDIRSTAKVYLKIRPWIEGHPNMAQFFDDEKARCPKCGSTALSHDGVHYTQAGEYPRYRCGNCGGFSRGRYTRNTKGKRAALLTN